MRTTDGQISHNTPSNCSQHISVIQYSLRNIVLNKKCKQKTFTHIQTTSFKIKLTVHFIHCFADRDLPSPKMVCK